MKIFVFGSCSGTEPYVGRHHTALALEIDGRVYWFDAGEGCSHTAHTMGVDLLRVSEIFISHPHMDHVGGLANLLWTVRKLTRVKKQSPVFGDLHVYMPNMDTWNGVLSILKNSEGGYANDYQTLAYPISDGVLLDNGTIRVTAGHNLHLKEPANGVWQSFSFLIEAEGKRIVYSGDVKDLSELSEWLREGCDLLLMETGHHHPVTVCQRLAEEYPAVSALRFFHHGRAILNDYNGMLEQCRAICPRVEFCNDGEVFTL
ncbi:MAG: ribonuclease Z [Clostridia bacterium]|nr:ribonuclease Z [Clostridia bacterium]